jgi:type IV pilus assembly protein PilW
MIGIVIGLLVILVIYNLLAAAENYKRLSIGASDAQITGLLSHFILGRDASNGGNGIALASDDLINCVDWNRRPIPVLITDSGDPAVSDSFIAFNSGSPHVLWPVDFFADAPPGSSFVVQTPNGFTSPLPTVGQPYLVVAMTNDGTGGCELTRVTAASTPPTPQGLVTLTHTGSGLTYKQGSPARLFNLGPIGQASRIRYDVASDQLRSTNLLPDAGGVAPGPTNPIAQNIVLMKVQYGVDTTAIPDDIIDCWTPAANDDCGDFSEPTVRGLVGAAGLVTLNRILAVRIGIVVRSDEPDMPAASAKDPALTAAGRTPVVLFNCSADTDAACQNRVVVPAGSPPSVANPNCAPAVICDYWRYRTYEAVVPLRNVIFKATLP